MNFTPVVGKIYKVMSEENEGMRFTSRLISFDGEKLIFENALILKLSQFNEDLWLLEDSARI